jgi:hypothetical protein
MWLTVSSIVPLGKYKVPMEMSARLTEKLAGAGGDAPFGAQCRAAACLQAAGCRLDLKRVRA